VLLVTPAVRFDAVGWATGRVLCPAQPKGRAFVQEKHLLSPKQSPGYLTWSDSGTVVKTKHRKNYWEL